jgi:Fungal chitosanase of glycosyl hydrolase group 75
MYGSKVRFAIFGDVGCTKLGEGSIQLHREPGFERIIKGRVWDMGIDSGVVTIVFPNSRDRVRISAERIRSRADILYAHLTSNAPAVFPELRMGGGARRSIHRFGVKATMRPRSYLINRKIP